MVFCLLKDRKSVPLEGWVSPTAMALLASTFELRTVVEVAMNYDMSQNSKKIKQQTNAS